VFQVKKRRVNLGKALVAASAVLTSLVAVFSVAAGNIWHW
jgi:hypothetical protein